MTVNSTIRSYVKLLTLHSFPTRRSSDLRQGVPGGRAGRGGRDGKTVVAAVTIPYIPPPLSPAARTFVAAAAAVLERAGRSEEHTSELQSLAYLVCRFLLENKIAMLPAQS